jgi:hypothetical protein
LGLSGQARSRLPAFRTPPPSPQKPYISLKTLRTNHPESPAPAR